MPEAPLDDAARKELERRIYDRLDESGRAAYGAYWDPALYREMLAYELEPDLERLARRTLVDRTVLVLGAGVADVAAVARYTSRITALNISEREIAAVREAFPEVETVVGDAEELEPGRRFEAIYCHSVLHHLLPFERVVERLHTALEPGGILFVAAEPGRLNPLAAAARAWLPSREHTPGERPFVFTSYHRVLKPYFEILAVRHYFLVAMIWPFLARRLPRARPLWRLALRLTLALERVVRSLLVFDNLFWIVAGAYRRREPTGQSSQGGREMPDQDDTVESPPSVSPEHRRLAVFEGRFRAEVKLYMGPGEPMVSTGLMESRFVLGGRFLHQSYTGDPAPGPLGSFAGRGYFGYNQVAGRYEGLWIDTASTMMQFETGAVNEDGKVWTMRGEMQDPRTGGTLGKRTVITVQDPDHHTMETYFTREDQEFKAMEIAYSRAT